MHVDRGPALARGPARPSCVARGRRERAPQAPGAASSPPSRGSSSRRRLERARRHVAREDAARRGGVPLRNTTPGARAEDDETEGQSQVAAARSVSFGLDVAMARDGADPSGAAFTWGGPSSSAGAYAPISIAAGISTTFGVSQVLIGSRNLRWPVEQPPGRARRIRAPRTGATRLRTWFTFPARIPSSPRGAHPPLPSSDGRWASASEVREEREQRPSSRAMSRRRRSNRPRRCTRDPPGVLEDPGETDRSRGEASMAAGIFSARRSPSLRRSRREIRARPNERRAGGDRRGRDRSHRTGRAPCRRLPILRGARGRKSRARSNAADRLSRPGRPAALPPLAGASPRLPASSGGTPPAHRSAPPARAFPRSR